MSPGSDRIVFAQRGGAQQGIFVLPATGGVLPQLVFGTLPGDLRPLFSPDGQFIAVTDRQGGRDLFTVPSNGGPRSPVNTSTDANHAFGAPAPFVGPPPEPWSV